MIALGVDAGASSSRWLLVDGDSEVARGRAEPVTGHVFTDTERTRTLERVAGMCAQVRAHAAPQRVVAGVTGLDRDSSAARLLAGALADGLGLPRDRVHVLHDMDVAYHAVFRPGEGVLVYGGTGSIAYHVPVDASGFPPGLRIGGHGYLIDDAGGGFWIGQQALRWVMREHDRLGRLPDTPLARAVHAHVGSDTWAAVREHVYGGGRSAVAAFAPAVGAAAAESDAVARAILREAGEELARLVRIAFARVGRELPVTLAGGVVHLGDVLFEALRAGMPSTVALRASTIEPVEAAARLARARLG